MLDDMVERVGRENKKWNIEDRDDRGIISNWSRESNRIGIVDFRSGSELESKKVTL